MKSLGSIRRSFAPWADPASKPFISVKNVTKKFGDFTAVDDLSLNIYTREFFALLGASGCGKIHPPAHAGRFRAADLRRRSSSTARTWRASRPTAGRST